MKSSNVTKVVLWSVATLTVTLVLATRAQGRFIYGAPVKVPKVNSPYGDSHARISPDGLHLYFVSNRPDGISSPNYDIWVASRPSLMADWNPPVKLPGSINTDAHEYYPCISTDGLTLYFGTRVEDSIDLWFSTRASLESPWPEPVTLGESINTPEHGEEAPSLPADGLSLYFNSNRPDATGFHDIYLTTRQTDGDPWQPPVNLGPNINTWQYEIYPFVSPDGLALFFSRGLATMKCFVSRRDTTEDSWGPALEFDPVNIPELGTQDFSFSPLDSKLYFVAYADIFDPTTFDIWQVDVTPTVDFNGDGEVDGTDVLILAAHWEQGDPAYDIAPIPFGDGIVDLQDLTALARYIGKDVTDGTLVAHWALDEADGIVAYDSVAANDGLVLGSPMWQPDGGQVDGALALDGATFVFADGVVNPADGPFSVLTWIKGGALGQVLVSQVTGENWLMADAAAGTLATTLAPPKGRNPIPPLVSDTVITDDTWHRIGLVWDGTSRALYVDDVLVAEDVRGSLANCSGDLTLGCDGDRNTGTFFTGLIDDVRIYNRAVRP